MPAHKLIGQKTKLNLSFDMEYRIMDKFDQTEFKTRHLIKEQNLGNFLTDNGTFSISVFYAFDLGHLMVKRTNVIEIENYDNYTQESGRQYIRHNSVGNTLNKSPHSDIEIKPLSLPNNPVHPIEHNLPLTDRSHMKGLDQSLDKMLGYHLSAQTRNSPGTEAIRYHTPPMFGFRPEPTQKWSNKAHSFSNSSPVVSPELDNLTIPDDPFIMETPPYPSFNLQLSSFSPFRDNLTRSPFSDPEDAEDMSGRSTSITPAFKIKNWKEMGIPPSTKNPSIISTKIPNTLATRDNDQSFTKLDQFINMIQNPDTILMKETESTGTIADYFSTLDRLIGSS
jgi:hypothetical protein